jgi:hypothetical protein
MFDFSLSIFLRSKSKRSHLLLLSCLRYIGPVLLHCCLSALNFGSKWLRMRYILSWFRISRYEN